MYEPLVPCPGCRRHVRAAAGACPFCAAAIDASRIAPDARTRLSRGALFAVAAASVAIAGCSSDDTKTATDAGTDTGVVDTGGPAPAYGAPADTGMTDDTGGPVAAYGAPPDTGAVDDTGGGMPKYGAPPPPDSGTD
jgi:hypothetical protein